MSTQQKPGPFRAELDNLRNLLHKSRRHRLGLDLRLALGDVSRAIGGPSYTLNGAGEVIGTSSRKINSDAQQRAELLVLDAFDMLTRVSPARFDATTKGQVT